MHHLAFLTRTVRTIKNDSIKHVKSKRHKRALHAIHACCPDARDAGRHMRNQFIYWALRSIGTGIQVAIFSIFANLRARNQQKLNAAGLADGSVGVGKERGHFQTTTDHDVRTE